MQEAEYKEQFESMQQAAGVSTNLDLVEACVGAESVNFELFKEVARLNQEAAEQQKAVSLLEQQAGKLRSGLPCLLAEFVECLRPSFVGTGTRVANIHWPKFENSSCCRRCSYTYRM